MFALQIRGGVALTMAFAAASAAHAESPGRSMHHTAVVDAPLQQVWDLFTTKAGIESWMVPKCEVDFRVGGTIKTTYDPQGVIGGPGTIVHHILTVEPFKEFSGRFDAPENAPVAKIAEQAWSFTRFEPVGRERTRITFDSYGFGTGDEWDRAYEFFERGNAYELERLRTRLARPELAQRDDKILARLSGMAGGEWIFENAGPDGKVFRGRAVYELGPDGQSILARSWLGDASGMFYHGLTTAHRNPGGGVCFYNINESGATAGGMVELDGESLIWDWNQHSLSDKRARFRAEMRFQAGEKDAFEFVLSSVAADGALKELVRTSYRRVADAPLEYRALKKTSE